MGGFKLQVKSYQLEISETGLSGTRVYLEDEDGTDDLPELGDSWDDEYWSLICRSKRQTLLGDAPHARMWTLQYSASADPEAAGDEEIPIEDLPVTMEIGAEGLNLGKQPNVKWKDAQGQPTTVPVTQDMFKLVGQGNYRVSKVYKSWNDMLAKFLPKIGKINNATWRIFPRHSVLCVGVSASEFRNEESELRVKCDVSFQFREISWRKLWNVDDEAWRETTQDLYTESNFNELFQEPEP